jgi:hypothetical protein
MTEYHDAVGDALEAWVHGLPLDETASGSGDIGILGDWIAVVSMVRVNADGVPVTEYYLCMKDGTMLPHMALGMLQVGNHLISDQTGERDG